MQGEQAVADYLKEQGFTIIARNYRQRYGEIDLIGRKKNMLTFVEVKTRTHQFIDPAEVIVSSKQRKIILTAYTFLNEYAYTDMECRFDIALVNHAHEIHYIANAFAESD